MPATKPTPRAIHEDEARWLVEDVLNGGEPEALARLLARVRALDPSDIEGAYFWLNRALFFWSGAADAAMMQWAATEERRSEARAGR